MSECNKAGPDCEGPVTYWTRPNDYSSWLKCAHHQDQANGLFDRVNRTYGVTSDVAPGWIDPSVCGEVWDDD